LQGGWQQQKKEEEIFRKRDKTKAKQHHENQIIRCVTLDDSSETFL
jgi:hypothetical protein